MTHSQELDKLLPALLAAQADFPAIPKDGYNLYFKSKFSTLKATQTATRPVLQKHGLLVSQFPSTDFEGRPALTTWLAHQSGQYIYEVAVLAMVKSDPQAQGSAISYLRRYAYSAILGLVTDEDDDGNAATFTMSKPDPAQEKANKELSRLIAAAKRAGVSKEDAEKEFRENTGHQLVASPATIEAIIDYADVLVGRAVEKEMK